MGIDAVKKIAKLFVKAINSTGNALGDEGSPIEKIADFGELFPDILAVLGSFKNLPAELRDLDHDELGEVVNAVGSELDLPGEKADKYVQAGLSVYNAVVPMTIRAVQGAAVDLKQAGAVPAKV